MPIRSIVARRCICGLALLSLSALPAAVAFAPAPALANGQSAHLRVTDRALQELPDGPLRDFLTRPELRVMLDNGSMFPDGGYPLGSPHAELAHWEPFQLAYRQWIMDTFEPPYEGEAAEYVAFALGLGSHGMSDQLYDGWYITRVARIDPTDPNAGDFDQSSDIAIVAETQGGLPTPRNWVPVDELVAVYASASMIDVDPGVITQGQGLLRIAIDGVRFFASNPDRVAQELEAFPWGNTNLLVEEVPGSPAFTARVVARYWQVGWNVLHGCGYPDNPILDSWPADGAAAHETDFTSIDSWVSVVFTKGLDARNLLPSSFTIADEAGAEVPFEVQVYYGQDSHLVHLKPTEDLLPDMTYTVTVEPGVGAYDGTSFVGGHVFRFSTGAVAPMPANPGDWLPECELPIPPDTDTDTGGTDSDGTDTDPDTAGTAGGSATEGSTSGATTDGASATDVTSAATGGDASSGDGAGATSDGGTAGAADADDSGCGCSTARGAGGLPDALGGLALLGFAVGAGRRRTRGRAAAAAGAAR